MKKCGICKRIKDYVDFYRNASRKDGFANKCKDCSESIKRDRKGIKKREPSKYPSGIDGVKMRSRALQLKRAYGITLDEYDTMILSQNGVCSICGKEETVVMRGARQSLSVDHCHSTNRIRGLLCSKCNRGLGAFGDDIDIMVSAISYLKQCG